MLRANLATRPFYNERAVDLVLGLVAVVGLVVLYLESGRIIELSRLNTERTRQAEIAEREGARLSVLAAGIQRLVSPEALDEVTAAAREANLLIDQRVFSWTDFFNRIETTLPLDVMMTEVRPDIEPGSIEVTMGVLGRSLGAIDAFIGALEDSGAFTEVLNPVVGDHRGRDVPGAASRYVSAGNADRHRPGRPLGRAADGGRCRVCGPGHGAGRRESVAGPGRRTFC